MDRPLGVLLRALHSLPPLPESALLADVNLLAGTDETDHDTPVRDATGELDEVLRLRSRRAIVLGMLRRDHLGIKGPLCLIEHQHVLGWYETWPARIRLDVVFHAADACLASAPGRPELVLQHLDEWPVATQEHGRRRWSSTCSRNGKFVKVASMDRLQSDQRLASTRHAGDQHQVAGLRRGRMVDDFADGFHSGSGRRVGPVDPAQLSRVKELASCLDERR